MSDDILNPLKTRQLIGMDNYFEDLLKSYNSKKLPKVMLISGKKGLGKFTLINHFLNYVFSKDTYNFKEKIINEDSKVYKSQLNGIFHNILHIKNEGRKKTKIDDVRNLKTILSQSTINGNLRFIILDDVEKLNASSSNALLKTIEEPSKNNYFILIDNQEGNLIKTIDSRCLKIKVFINKLNKSKIIESLIKEKKIEKVLNNEDLDLSPGLFLRYNNICLENGITASLDYITRLEKLLNLYKKSKDKIFLNLAILFTNEYFYNLSLKKRRQIFLFDSVKNKIIHYINDFFIYNLNLNSVLNLIQSQLNNAK